MDSLKNVIVGVDFSECSRCALEQAVRIATWNHATLRVLHAVEDLGITETAEALSLSVDEVRGETRRQAILRLGNWAEQAGALAEHSREVILGPPIDVLLQEIKRTGADLLVLGVTGDARPHTGVGTLAAKCLRKAPCKVMLVKQSHPRPFRRIVACVDFSSTSQVAVTQTLRIASQDRSEVHFLHVHQPYWMKSGYFVSRLSAREDFEAAHHRVLENNLRNFVNSNAGVNSTFCVREADSQGEGIARYCREVDADLVILGTRGKTNLKYVLLGSTVERLLREVPCSTLVVRPVVEQAVDGVAPEIALASALRFSGG